MTKDRVILGIDPGTIVMGYGVLTIEGNKPKLEAMGILQLNKYEDHYLRLRKIFERVLGLIDQYHPDELAIEAPFFGKNVQSMLKLGSRYGCLTRTGAPDILICPAKDQDVHYRKWECCKRTSGRDATALPAYSGSIHVAAIGCDRWIGSCRLPLFPDE